MYWMTSSMDQSDAEPLGSCGVTVVAACGETVAVAGVCAPTVDAAADDDEAEDADGSDAAVDRAL